MKTSRILVILGLTATVSLDAAVASTLFDDGVNNYKAGRFQQSARTLAAAVAHEPAGQLVRYYLACALVKVNDHRRAVEEFRVAYLLDPSTPTGNYCRTALHGYKAAVPDAGEVQRVRLELAQRPSGLLSAQTPEMDRALRIIRRQTDFEKSKHMVDDVRREKVVRGVAEQELKAIDQQMQEQIARLSDPIIFTPEPRANPLPI